MSSLRLWGRMWGREGRRSRRGKEVEWSRTGASSRSDILGKPLLEIEEIEERGVVAFDQASISASGATIEHNESECLNILVRCCANLHIPGKQ